MARENRVVIDLEIVTEVAVFMVAEAGDSEEDLAVVFAVEEIEEKQKI